VQRVWTEHTCPFSPFSLVKHSPSGGMYGRKSFAKSRAHYGGWRFISMQGDRSPKVYNDPTAAMSILQSNHSSATSADSSAGSVASAVSVPQLPSVSASSFLVTGSNLACTVRNKRKEDGCSPESSQEGNARAKTTKTIAKTIKLIQN
jgi:hypothetical protein